MNNKIPLLYSTLFFFWSVLLPQAMAKTVLPSFSCNALVCNNQVNAAIDAGCSGFISIDGILESPCYGSGVQYQLEVKADKNNTIRQTVNASASSGLNEGIRIDSDFISCGNTYTVKISRTENGSARRSCSTRVKFEDSTPPTIVPTNQTIVACEGISEEALKKQIQFYVSDACKSTTTSIQLGRFPTNFCSGTATIPVTVQAVDFCGNRASSYFDIRVTRPTQLVAPKDTLLTCGSGTHPSISGYPSLDVDGDGEGDVSIIETACSFSTSYTDTQFSSCGNGAKVYRTWLVYDWCTSTSPISTYQQFIHVKDKEAPEVNCPEDDEIGGKDNPKLLTANGYNCSAVLQGIIPLVVDDCDGVVTPRVYTITNRTNSSVSYSITDADIPEGRYFAEYLAEDACGNRSALCKYYFNVQAGGTPIAICKDQLNIGLAGSESIIRASDIDEGSYDNCSSISLSIRKDGSSLWANSITYSCADAANSKKVHLRVVNAAGTANTCWLSIKASYGGSPCSSTNSQEEEEEEETTEIVVEETTDTSTNTTEEEDNTSEDITITETTSSTETAETITEEEPTYATLKGKIISPTEQPVSQVAVAVTNAQGFQENERSDAAGQFNLNLPKNSTYQLQFDKSSDLSNGVSIIDMVLILRHILGLDLFHSNHQYVAADINSSGNVTTYDAVALRQLILGDQQDADMPAWRFADVQALAQEHFRKVEEEMVLDMLSADKNVRVMAIKVGDVSGNADPNNLVSSQPRNHQKTPLHLSNQYLQKGEIYTVPIHFSKEEQLLGVQLALTTTQLEIVSIQNGALSTSQYQQSNRGISIAWDALSAPSTSQDLFFEMTVKAQQSGWLKEMVHLDTKQIIPMAYTQSEEVRSISLEFSENMPTETKLSSFPNPFKEEVTVSFYLQEKQTPIFTIYRIDGQLVQTISITGQKGYNEVSIPATMLSKNQILLVQLQTLNGVYTSKLIRAN